jgi:hypothetical protein
MPEIDIHNYLPDEVIELQEALLRVCNKHKIRLVCITAKKKFTALSNFPAEGNDNRVHEFLRQFIDAELAPGNEIKEPI